jgi:gliding motility-associated-like protein
MSVSVQPETGFTVLNWTRPASEIDAYIVYSYVNGDGTALDTVWDPSVTSITLQSPASKYFSVSYVVASMRLPRCTSIFSNIINSIYESVSIDTCRKKIDVTWNSYPSIPEAVTGYSVLLAVNGGSFNVISEVGPDITSFRLDDYVIDAEYCFVIRANLANSAFSTSNKTCILTRMQRPPAWINADEATVNSDDIVVSFTIDPMSELNRYSLSKKTGSNGSYAEISRPSAVNGSVRYTDTEAETDSVNFYLLSAINSCNLPVTVSNEASNIVLSSEIAGQNIVLSWNSYKRWLGNISDYKLFINTGRGFEERAVISASDSVYLQDYQQIMYEVTGNEVCFYVSASENSNPYGISGLSVSSVVCIAPIENITVPNVFTPNNDLDNDLFKPVLSFTPIDYHLIISDRHGVVLFESRDFLEEWDGTKNGSPQSVGVCLWFLKLTTPSGKSISKTGTVTIIK